MKGLPGTVLQVDLSSGTIEKLKELGLEDVAASLESSGAYSLKE